MACGWLEVWQVYLSVCRNSVVLDKGGRWPRCREVFAPARLLLRQAAEAGGPGAEGAGARFEAFCKAANCAPEATARSRIEHATSSWSPLK